MTRIRITIDELILDGATDLDRAQLVQAVQEALAQQVAAHGLPSSANVARLSENVPGLAADTVAQRIVRAVYGGGR